jgi:sec-independent protein translocase protein TatB
MSFLEIVIIAVLALILLGPDRLPDAARKAARGIRMLREASDGLRAQLSQLERAGEEGAGEGGAAAPLRELQKIAGEAAGLVRDGVLALGDPAPSTDVVATAGAPTEPTVPAGPQGAAPPPDGAPPPEPDARSPESRLAPEVGSAPSKDPSPPMIAAPDPAREPR